MKILVPQSRCSPSLRVGVLVEMGAVEVPQPVQIVGEVGGNPVENHAEAVAVEVVDEVGEVIGRAMPRGRGEIADRLVAPAPVERMLGDRQELDVGELGVLEVRGQLVGQLAIIEKAGRRLAASFPRAEMDLVEGDRPVECLPLGSRWPSILVVPGRTW